MPSRISIATGAICASLCAAAATVADIAGMTREAAFPEPWCEVEGVVTCSFATPQNSFTLADASDPDGPAVYVCGRLEGREPADVEGALAVGDVVRVRGNILPFMLEPGVYARTVTVERRMQLDPPREVRLADMRSGAFNNRRVAIRGVLRSARIEKRAGEDPLTALVVGTCDGVVRVRVYGEWPDLAECRDAEVLVNGVCVPGYNARAEFLRPEIEAVSREAISVVAPPANSIPRIENGVGRPAGAMTWNPKGGHGHLRRVVGEVTYVNRTRGAFVLQSETAVLVDVEDGSLPSVGDIVEATGFPTMFDDCGVLESSDFATLGRSSVQMRPEDFTGADLADILGRDDSGEFDAHYRFVRIEGRVMRADILPSGGAELEVDLGTGRIVARMESARPDFTAAFVDRPMACLTGVLKVNLEENEERGQGMKVHGFTLLLRSEADVVPVYDAASRKRFLMRIGAKLGLWALLPLMAYVLVAYQRSVRRREKAAAVAADRKRLAEDLHDTIAQHLSGARLLLYSVQGESDSLSEQAKGALAMAGDVLESARREMRDAILNLQSDELVTHPPAKLLRMVARRTNGASGVSVRTMLRGIPPDMPPGQKTNLLAVVQEAVSNAVKHGHARHVLVLSDPLPSGGGFTLRVLNDGEPFDAEAALGPETGHFGLSGMRERAGRTGGSVAFGRNGKWTEVRIEWRVP